MIRFQFFPRSQGITKPIHDVISCFEKEVNRIKSPDFNLSSNEVLEVIRPHLQEFGFTCETGKAAAQKISVPVLFGYKDIFQACMMFEVEYLVIVVRNVYRGHKDFEIIHTFLETLYISNRLHLPLKGILLIGY